MVGENRWHGSVPQLTAFSYLKFLLFCRVVQLVILQTTLHFSFFSSIWTDDTLRQQPKPANFRAELNREKHYGKNDHADVACRSGQVKVTCPESKGIFDWTNIKLRSLMPEWRKFVRKISDWVLERKATWCHWDCGRITSKREHDCSLQQLCGRVQQWNTVKECINTWQGPVRGRFPIQYVTAQGRNTGVCAPVIQHEVRKLQQ